MKTILTIDFGSTNTKVTLIDVEKKEIVANAVAYTTIETDVRVGLNKAKEQIFKQCSIDKVDYQIACSSAAGGLKMISCGLVPDLTVKASKMAASSAGAKVLKCYSYELSEIEQKEIYDINPDIMLLCGGIDGGNKEVIIHNAKMLAEIDLPLCIIVAGNKSASSTVCKILRDAGKSVIPCENVLPDFGNLNIYPVKNAIRDVFIDRIIHAKGLDEAQKLMNEDIIPTPLAVFEATELLSRGIKEEKGLGKILLFDVGGATTDVYSMNDGTPKNDAVLKGLREPYAKRTVEGDIGVRYSLPFLVEAIDFTTTALPNGLKMGELNEWIEKCKDCSLIPTTESERLSDMFFARNAIEISINRHCGIIEEVYTHMGRIFSQTGKDLTDIDYVIGVGGSVINSVDPKYVLEGSLFSEEAPNMLKPKNPKFLLDKRNIMASMGLVSKIDKKLALEIMKKYLISL